MPETTLLQALIALGTAVFVALATFWMRRWGGKLDSLENRLGEVEQNYVGQSQVREELRAMRLEISKVHDRADDIYRLLANRREKDAHD